MKMNPKTFEALKRDMTAICVAKKLCYAGGMRDAWNVFHRVMQDRSYDTAHPYYDPASPHYRARIVPYVGHNAGIGAIYAEGLDDSHIETALRKIVAT